ncbi:MAG: transcriptional regulator NrdR [Saccharofermentanales bacterium]|jgi:transcriptional repressor NrdR|nr:transcriptional regulator NrdR [Bacillota bacterium]NLB09314.1 transcriptional repressor NrdR [Clostridiales bacterium]
MKCPHCGYDEDRVIDSRPVDEGIAIRRRRECMSCLERFTTYERVENMSLMVIKKDGSRQPFERNKLINGILKSCEKRPVSTQQITKIVDTIERQLENSLRREVPTRELGELVLQQLRDIDEVAYIRFASVYREFVDIGSFFDAISSLTESTDRKDNE